MSPATPQKTLGTLDKAGAYFQKTLGVLPHISEDARRAAVAYTARNSRDKHDFLFLTDTLGLDDVVNDMAGREWRDAG